VDFQLTTRLKRNGAESAGQGEWGVQNLGKKSVLLTNRRRKPIAIYGEVLLEVGQYESQACLALYGR
jgi:hypothetical protein